MAVAAVSIVLAIGIGVYAGLGSTAEWRRQTNDASFEALQMHDLRVILSPGTFIDQGSLVDVVAGIDAADSVDAVAERLVVDSQVDTGGDTSILVSARLVGMTFGSAEPVDDVWIRDGVAPANNQAGGQAVLEAKFVDDRGLPATGSLVVGSGRTVTYGGVGVSPDDFFYEGPEGTLFAEGELAIVYLSLASVQDITSRPGLVNDVVLTVRDPETRDLIASQIADALATSGLSAQVQTREDSDAVRVLYEDIDNDQRVWNALSALVMGAAALAAFNLITRIVEAQRREIGIGMALGVPRRKLAIRPLLMGLQVAVLGTVTGVVVGLLLGNAFGNLLKSLLPLPDHRQPFQFGVYAQGAVLGLVVPIVAAAIPVWRALRVQPIEAIRTGHLAARTSRLADWTAKLRLPGSTLSLMPVRNVLRNPRRAVLTAIGVGAAITALVGVLGMLDSFNRTLDAGGAEFTQGNPDRVVVQLDTFYPAESEVVSSVRDADAVEHIDTGLRLPVTALAADGSAVDLLVETVDLANAAWTPTLLAGEAGSARADGLLLAQKAADDLSVGVGDVVTLRHPVRVGPAEFMLTESEFVVAGIHANPIRTFAFLDRAGDERFGLTSMVNLVQVYPASGADASDAQRAIFGVPGVASSQPVAAISDAIDKTLDQFLSFIIITAGAVLILALLISFNASRITVEEREREHATMRAFGLPLRSVLGVVIRENVLVGIAATAIGLGGGLMFLEWTLSSLTATTLPDVGIAPYVSPITIALAAAVGILAAALAPLFLTRRLQRMDLPGSLRVME